MLAILLSFSLAMTQPLFTTPAERFDLQATDTHNEQKLARIYAPELIFDSHETHLPIDVDSLLPLELFARNKENNKQASGSKVLQFELKRYEEWPELNQNYGLNKYTLHFKLNPNAPQAPFASYYMSRHNGRYFEIQYWWYSIWNDATALGFPAWSGPCGNHVGDWEHMSIRLDQDKLKHALQSNLIRDYRSAILGYFFSQHNRHQHRERKFVFPETAQFRSGTHVQVYPALGSHAAYPHAGEYHLMNLLGINFTDKNNGKGTRVASWKAPLKKVKDQAWKSYPGHWGQDGDPSCDWLENVSSANNDGPVGPGQGKKILESFEGDWYDITRSEWEAMRP